MRRREFIAGIAGATAWPLAARAQQAMPVIGFLVGGTPSSHGHLVAAFAKRLRELGWIEGRTVATEIRWAEGRTERYAEVAAELGLLKIDVIVAPGLGVPAAKQAAPTIPIVFVGASDPVGTGLVATLARPDGNVTGLSFQQTDLAGKRLELLREIVPGLRHLAIVGNANAPGAVREMVGSGLSARYLKNFELVRKKRPYLESFLPNDVQTEAPATKEAAATKNGGVDEKAIARAVETAVNKIANEIFQQIYIALLVIAGIYLVYNYGLTVLGFLAAAVYMIGHGVGIW